MPSQADLEGIDSNVDLNQQHYLHSVHNVRHSYEDEMMNQRRMSEPDLQMYGQQRPTTPAQQMNSGKPIEQ